MNFIKAQVISHTNIDLVKMIACGTRLTFKKDNPFNTDLTNITDNDKSIVNNLIMADHSPLEMGDVTVLLTGISKTLLAQWTRFRLESVISSSMHYTLQDEYLDTTIPQFVIPIEVYQCCEENNSIEPIKDFLKSYQQSHNDYLSLKDKWNLHHSVTRYVENQALRGTLLIKMNVREWLLALGRRLCKRNCSEIAYVSWIIRNELMKISPDIFKYAIPPCARYGKCSEYKLTCGAKWIEADENEKWNHLLELSNKWYNTYQHQH